MAASVQPLSDYPPAGLEVRLIQRYAPLQERRVLEIGCGDGRLTRQVAHLARSVVAVEPNAEAIASARELAKAEGITNVVFRVGSAEQLRLRGKKFDMVLFSWSL